MSAAAAGGDPRIKVERPTPERLTELNVTRWPVWSKEPVRFPWAYEERETCYFLEGEVVVKTDAGEVTLRQGDLVTFPKGLACTWDVKQPVKKHYRFG